MALLIPFLVGYFCAFNPWFWKNVSTHRGNTMTPLAWAWFGPPWILGLLPWSRKRGGCWWAVLYPVAFLVGVQVMWAGQHPKVAPIPHQALTVNGLSLGMSVQQAQSSILDATTPARVVQIYEALGLLAIVENNRIEALLIESYLKPKLAGYPPLLGQTLEEADDTVGRLTSRQIHRIEDGLYCQVAHGSVLVSFEEGKVTAISGASVKQGKSTVLHLGQALGDLVKRSLQPGLQGDDYWVVPLGIKKGDIYLRTSHNLLESVQIEPLYKGTTHRIPPSRLFVP